MRIQSIRACALNNRIPVLWDTSVGIVTRYGLEGPAIESQCGRHFSHLSESVLGPTQPPIQWVPGLSWG